MAGRGQALSDSRVIQILSEAYVPVAENVGALQRQEDDKGVFFRHIAEQGHYGGRTFPTNTRQGGYAFTADGRFLGSINGPDSRDPDKMVAVLDAALRNWQAGAMDKQPSPVVPAETSEDSGYPIGGLALKLAARDLPREHDERADDWRRNAWNLDYAWFTAEEAAALVPEQATVGATRLAPKAALRRLGRFHLRDFVRGEPRPWAEDAIKHADVKSEVVSVDGASVRLTLSGAIRLEEQVSWVRPDDGIAHSYPSGYDATLEGEAVWDAEQRAFTSFELLATGPRWGAQQYNNRTDDLGPAPLGIAFELAGDSPSEHTPPHCLRTWRRKDLDGPSGIKVDQESYFRDPRSVE